MDKVNVAVVGCGIFGQVHAETYAAFPLSRLIAVCDIDASKARHAAEKFSCRHATSIEQIASDERIHAVSVVTPDFAHLQPCLELAKAGKHLLIEKPLATSVDEARRIVSAVEDAGVIGMVDFHNRYHPAFAPIKQRLDGGQMGRPQMMYARLSDRLEVATEWFAWSSKTGPEWFLGSHIADLACWLFGQLPVRVFAQGCKGVLAGRGVDCYDSLQVHLGFREGMATLETSWIVPNAWPMICDFYATLQTTTARADVDLSRQATTIADGGRFDWPMVFAQGSIGRDAFGFFAFPIHDFVRAVAEGRPSPIPLKAGLDNVRVIAAAVESAQSGKVVELRW